MDGRNAVPWVKNRRDHVPTNHGGLERGIQRECNLTEKGRDEKKNIGNIVTSGGNDCFGRKRG